MKVYVYSNDDNNNSNNNNSNNNGNNKRTCKCDPNIFLFKKT